MVDGALDEIKVTELHSSSEQVFLSPRVFESSKIADTFNFVNPASPPVPRITPIIDADSSTDVGILGNLKARIFFLNFARHRTLEARRPVPGAPSQELHTTEAFGERTG